MQVAPHTRLALAAFAAAALCAALLSGLALAGQARAGQGLSKAIEAPVSKLSIGARCKQQTRLAARGRGFSRRIETRMTRRCANRLRRAAKRKRQPRQTAQSSSTPSIGPLVIGIDGGYGDWSDTETEYRASLGAAITRHEWDTREPIDDQDELVYKAATEVHTRIYALLGENELGDPNQYREWVVAFIRRYGVGGSFWREHPELDASRYAMTNFELGNEPYFGEMTASEYAATVRPTLEEVQRLGLPARIILPSRVYGNDTSWMDTLYKQIPNLNNLFFGFADHPYWYGHDPAQVNAAGPLGRVAKLRSRMNELGASSKPILISEYGESTASCGGECVSETTQAQHLTEMIEAVTTHPEWGIEMLSVFQLLDRGTNSPDRELQFGLLRQNGTPKPAYAVVDTAMQQYRG
jgi:hypothetical protein